MIVAGKDLFIGDIIKFKTINSYDPSFKQGVVLAFCSYPIAAMYGDQIAYHAEILKSPPEGLSIPSDVRTLTFIVVKLSSGDTVAVAFNWVELTSLSIIDTSNNVTIKIFNVPSQEAATILQLLRDANYICKEV